MRRFLALLTRPVLHLSGDGSRNAVIGWWAVLLAVAVLVVVGVSAVLGHLIIGLAIGIGLLLSVVPVLKREYARRGTPTR